MTPATCSLLLFLAGQSAANEPLRLHPDNPHYLLFRGKPVVLITSGEHYGTVLNREFDFAKYLDTLAADGLNLTRTFSGAYVEPQGAFRIERNTLAPAGGKLIAPWARSAEPGYVNGGNKFDLTKWDDAYFSRLREFMEHASRRGVVVELNLFTPMYEDAQWNYSPMKAANNMSGVGRVGKHEVYTLDKEPALLDVQEAMVRKIVTELNRFDNLYWEVCNEPYFGGITQAWHDRIVDVIVATESRLPQKHLISWNVANGSKRIEPPAGLPPGGDRPRSLRLPDRHEKIERLHPDVSILNFHYAHPPTAVGENYGLGRSLGLNETGFKGTGDDHYRMEAWEFILAGGGLYNNLDYSFCVGYEDGTFPVKAPTPGGGNARFRKQLGVLRDFVHSFEFTRMRPAAGSLRDLPAGARAQLLAEPSRQYALYLKQPSKRDSGEATPAGNGASRSFKLDLPASRYRIEWRDAVSGEVLTARAWEHAGGPAVLETPAGAREFAGAIRRAEGG